MYKQIKLLSIVVLASTLSCGCLSNKEGSSPSFEEEVTRNKLYASSFALQQLAKKEKMSGGVEEEVLIKVKESAKGIENLAKLAGVAAVEEVAKEAEEVSDIDGLIVVAEKLVKVSSAAVPDEVKAAIEEGVMRNSLYASSFALQQLAKKEKMSGGVEEEVLIKVKESAKGIENLAKLAGVAAVEEVAKEAEEVSDIDGLIVVAEKLVEISFAAVPDEAKAAIKRVVEEVTKKAKEEAVEKATQEAEEGSEE